MFEQAIFFGTNSILKFSKNDASCEFELCNLRYHFSPSDNDLKDSLKVMIFCLFHRNDLFYLNSMARKPLVTDIVFGSLLDIYNERLRHAVKYKTISDSKNDSIIIPAFLTEPLDFTKRLLEIEDNNGNNRHVLIKNYLPKQIDPAFFLEKYKYISNSDFTEKMEMTFETWWKIWIMLNSLLKKNLLFFHSDSFLKTLTNEQFESAAERTDDYSDSCLGCAEISSFLNTCHEWLKTLYKKFPPSYENLETFFYKLCFSSFKSDITFIEQPFLFYKVGPNRFFWDYLRHGNLLNAISRTLNRGQSGAYFESMIKKTLSQRIKKIANIELNYKIKDTHGEIDWEIDIMFIYESIVFIVEAKHNFKPESYHLASDVSVSSRIQDWEKRLTKQDEKIEKYKLKLYEHWESLKPKGAICIVCSLEVEFISSFEMKYWLLNGKIPRICTLDELVEFFQVGVCLQLLNHPNFIKFE
jgi:hypothetical protein